MTDELKQVADNHIDNMFRLLSAVFDLCQGCVVIPKDVLDKADRNFYIEVLTDENGMAFKFVKHEGMSPETLALLPKVGVDN